MVHISAQLSHLFHHHFKIFLLLFLVFCDMWSALVHDLRKIARQVASDSNQNSVPEPEKQVYLSLPRPGVCQE
jgi:hypothetical protein